ncbi:MAG: T9SS type A sorting domain-containing protein [Bacteroidales bacterium]|nr:T9SS type A sorting domain-containing protein [Bacteroidales bacterium]
MVNIVANADSGFYKVISSNEDKRGSDVIEFPNFYIVSGSILDSNKTMGYIIKVNKNGAVEKVMELKNGVACRIKKHENNIDVFQSSYSYSDSVSMLRFTKLDTSLNVIIEKDLHIPDNTYIDRYNIDIDLKGNYVISGSVNTLDQQINLSSFIYKISNNGDSLNSIFFSNTSSLDRGSGVLISNNKYRLFVTHFAGNALGCIITMDSSLNIIDTVDISNDLYDIFSPIYTSDSNIIITTRRLDSNHLFVSKIDTLGNVLISKQFGKSSEISIPAYQKALSKNGSDIFFIGTSRFTPSSPFVGTGEPSQILIGKLNESLSLKWIKYIDKSVYFHAYSIIVTSDFGCICVGTFNDTINHNYKRDIFILKVDSNGTTTWTKNIKIPISKINIYPNPTSDYINISTFGSELIAELSIVDITGKHISKININTGQTRIDIRKLSPGVYAVEGATRTGRHFSGKFVKK